MLYLRHEKEHFFSYIGAKYYVAEGVGVPIVTQGKTLDMLQKNIAEAVQVFLHCSKRQNFNLELQIF